MGRELKHDEHSYNWLSADEEDGGLALPDYMYCWAANIPKYGFWVQELVDEEIPVWKTDSLQMKMTTSPSHKGWLEEVMFKLQQLKPFHSIFQTHLSFVLAALYAPLSWGAVEGLQLLLHDHQPLLDVQQTVMEALVICDALLTLVHLRLQTKEKGQLHSQWQGKSLVFVLPCVIVVQQIRVLSHCWWV